MISPRQGDEHEHITCLALALSDVEESALGAEVGDEVRRRDAVSAQQLAQLLDGCQVCWLCRPDSCSAYTAPGCRV